MAKDCGELRKKFRLSGGGNGGPHEEGCWTYEEKVDTKGQNNRTGMWFARNGGGDRKREEEGEEENMNHCGGNFMG